MAKRKPVEVVITLVNNIVFVLCFLLASWGVRLWTAYYFSSLTEDSLMWLRIIAVYSSIYTFIIFRILFGCLALESKRSRKKILSSYDIHASFGQRIQFHLTNTEYWLALLPFLIFILILPVSFGYEPIITAMFAHSPPSPLVQKLIVLAVATPGFFLLSLLAERKTARRLVSQRDFFEKETRKINSLLNREAVMIGGCVFMCAILMPFLLTALVTIARLSYAILPALAAIIFGILSVRHLRAIHIRRRFIKELQKICENRRHRISDIKHIYSSLFFSREGANFTLHTEGKSYACKLMHGIRRDTPMFFNEDGYGTRVRTFFFFRAEIFHHVTSFRYGFDAKNQKIIIVCPIPHKIFAKKGAVSTEVEETVVESKIFHARGFGSKAIPVSRSSFSRELDVGDSFAGYKFYNGTGFLNAVERGVLDR